jgi:DNA helicase HerA-like ATPase
MKVFVKNPIDEDIISSKESIVMKSESIAWIANQYTEDSNHLLGFLLTLNYHEMKIVTCDPWKRLCGGVPRNSFVAIKLAHKQVDAEDRHFCNRIILARITDSVPTPVESDLQSTIYQIHKVRAMLDPITQKELQWSALKASIIGTYYDTKDGGLAFGNDVDTFFSPHAYEVYVLTPEHLGILINSFVKCKNSLEIGRLRYTETPSAAHEHTIPIKVDPRDFVGYEYGHRTALFGKTRFGKSNTIKVIADRILSSDIKAGQIIFDPSGEYTYWNEQDGCSLFALHPEKCVRYSLNPRKLDSEALQNFAKPKSLKINFYDSVSAGHSLIVQLWDSEHESRPGYMLPILNWSPIDVTDAPNIKNISDYNHYWRTMSMWFALLHLTGFKNTNKLIPVNFRKNVKQEIIKKLGSAIRTEDGEFSQQQKLESLPAIYREVAILWEQHEDNKDWFPKSDSDGSSYFNGIEKSLLQILENDGSISGSRYLNPFIKYHDIEGSNTFQEISEHAQAGKTVLIDFAKADENVRKNLSDRICRKVLGDMMSRFSNNSLGDDFIVLYFEEAHTLFRQDDKDLDKNIYNKLAKEGAKFHLSMVYATQSMTTLSPDLLKNTENFIIAHLDDDREVREVTRKYAFRDVATDIQMTQSKGFVRMITLSHRFALPVQIMKFRHSTN